jgi:hypothetical protein
LSRTVVPAAHAGFASLTKMELHAWADALLACEPLDVQRCVDFVVAETTGLWHGRARAMMCRRLKHCGLGRTHCGVLVECITRRLAHGTFSEQFKDQLRLAIHLDPQRTLAVCRECAGSAKPYVRRYAEWALSLPASRDARR